MINLLYTTQPYNAIVVPSNEITFDSHWTAQEDCYSTTYNGAVASIHEYLNHIWIIGNKFSDQSGMKISYGNEHEIEIDINSVNTIFSKEILFTSINDISHGKYLVEVKKTGIGKALHISYFYYLNEKTITVHKKAKTLYAKNITSFEGWMHVSDKLISETEGASITFNSVVFSQFWITGDVDPNFGVIDVYVDDVFQSGISLYHEKHEENIVFYESPMNKIFENHTITLKNHDNRKVSIIKVQYIDQSGHGIEYDEVEGLINVTCDRFNHIRDYAECYRIEYAKAGSYIGNYGKIDFKFNGTRVHVVSFDQNNDNSGSVVNISIDGKACGSASLIGKTSTFKIVFSSDYLPFGEHLISIENAFGRGTLYVNSFLVDPIPKVGGHVLGFNDATENNGWVLDSSGSTPFFTSSSYEAFVIFKFHGTRFWLTGIRHTHYGECSLTIDDGEEIIIDGKTGINKFMVNSDRTNGNQGVLLYESDVLDFKDHTIKIIKKDNKEFRIINLLYTTQPYNAIVVPSNEITFDSQWTLESDGYSTKHNGARCNITEYMNHIWIIGNKIPNNQALMNIYYNTNKEENIDINNIASDFTNEILIKTLQTIPRDTYSIEIEKSGNPTENTKVLHISYFYYLNEKTINVPDESRKIGINEMENKKEGTWELIDDNIMTEEEGASISVDFYGNKFWLYGTLHPNYGTIDIIFDGQKQSSVSLYNEKYISNVVIYESPDNFPQDEHSIKLVNLFRFRIFQ